jgi:hypothetical protein
MLTPADQRGDGAGRLTAATVTSVEPSDICCRNTSGKGPGCLYVTTPGEAAEKAGQRLVWG